MPESCDSCFCLIIMRRDLFLRCSRSSALCSAAVVAMVASTARSVEAAEAEAAVAELVSGGRVTKGWSSAVAVAVRGSGQVTLVMWATKF